MKTFLYFVFTCLVSTGALLGALNAINPFPAFIIAFGVWVLFIWNYSRRHKRHSERNDMERNFRNYMRMQQRKSYR